MLEGKTILVEAEDAGLYWLRRNLITCDANMVAK